MRVSAHTNRVSVVDGHTETVSVALDEKPSLAALRSAIDEIRHHGHTVAVMTGAALEFSPMGLHAMALLGAITTRGASPWPP